MKHVLFATLALGSITVHAQDVPEVTLPAVEVRPNGVIISNTNTYQKDDPNGFAGETVNNYSFISINNPARVGREAQGNPIPYADGNMGFPDHGVQIGAGYANVTVSAVNQGRVEVRTYDAGLVIDKEQIVLTAPKGVFIAKDDDSAPVEIATKIDIQQINQNINGQIDHAVEQTLNKSKAYTDQQIGMVDQKARSYGALAASSALAIVATPPNGGLGVAGYTIQGQSAIAIGGRVPLNPRTNFVFSASRSQYATGVGIGVGWSW